MTKYWIIEPEVAGHVGPDSVLDHSVIPHRVIALDYAFDDWLGDDILESFPCFVVTHELSLAILEAGLTGLSAHPMNVSTSGVFEQLHPQGLALPEVHWAKIDGAPQHSDFWIADDKRLAVSPRAFELLGRFRIAHALVEAAGS